MCPKDGASLIIHMMFVPHWYLLYRSACCLYVLGGSTEQPGILVLIRRMHGPLVPQSNIRPHPDPFARGTQTSSLGSIIKEDVDANVMTSNMYSNGYSEGEQ